MTLMYNAGGGSTLDIPVSEIGSGTLQTGTSTDGCASCIPDTRCQLTVVQILLRFRDSGASCRSRCSSCKSYIGTYVSRAVCTHNVKVNYAVTQTSPCQDMIGGEQRIVSSAC